MSESVNILFLEIHPFKGLLLKITANATLGLIKTYLSQDINLLNIIAYISGVHSIGHFEMGRNTLLTTLNLLLGIFMPGKCPYSAASSAAIKAGNGLDSDW